MRLLRPQRSTPSQTPTRPRGWWRRWAAISSACAASLALLLALTAAVVLHSLDRPWIKARIQAFAHAAGGVEIDYRDVRVDGLSGAAVDDLVVRSPDEVRRFAPDLVRVGHVDVAWSLRSLLFGHGPSVDAVSISDVTLTVVADEHWRTSFDALPPSPPSPSVPTSHLASKFLGTAPPVGHLDVGAITIVLVQTDHGHAMTRTELRGITLGLVAARAEPTERGWHVSAHLGTRSDPVDLRLARTPDEREARASVWLSIDATPAALAAVLDLHTSQQTFAAGVPAEHHLHAEATVRFDMTAGQSTVHLSPVEADDGAVTADALVNVLDAGDPTIASARGDVDLARLLRWLPPGLVSITAERAHVRYQIQGLGAGPTLRFAEGGAADVDLDLANVDAAIATGAFQVGEGSLSLHAEPAVGGGVAGRLSLKVAAANLPSGSDRLDVEELAVDVDGRRSADGAVAGRMDARIARVERGGTTRTVARDAHVEIHADGLRPNADHPLVTPGDLTLSSEIGSLDVQSRDHRAILDGMVVRAHARLEGHPPYAADLDARIARLRISDAAGKALVDAPVRVQIGGRDIRLDADHPAASGGAVRATVEVGPLLATLDATKAPDAVDFALQAKAARLAILRPFLPPVAVAEVPWDRMGIALRSTGRVEHLAGADPALRQATQLDVDGPAFGDVAAKSLSLVLRSQGTASSHQVDLDLHAQGLAVAGGAAIDDHLTLHATVDRARPSLAFQLVTEGRAASKLTASLSFDRRRRVLLYDIDCQLAGLATVGPLLAKVRHLDAFDLSELEVALSARGVLLGAVDAIGKDDDAWQLAPDPAHTLAIEGTADLRVDHFRWSHGDTAVATPLLRWHGDMRADGARRTLDSKLEVASVRLDLGSRQVDLGGIDDAEHAVVIGSLADPEVELEQRLAIHSVEQGVVPAYPVGDISVTLSAKRAREGVVHVSDVTLANGLGGTKLALSGNVDIGAGRRTLSLTTSLTQDLARLSTVPERFSGRGKVSAEASVTSPDLVHYHVQSTIKGEDVNVVVAHAGITVEAANGEVPVTAVLVLGPDGIALERRDTGSPYSMLRFTDQHPLLTRSGFLSIASIKTPFVTIAPLVGNLEIEQNLVSLRQFEMGVRGGTITGQCGLDWDGPKSTFDLHVRASGVQSSHGEPFDGNIAVAVSAADRTINGRAEILRIGERHLRDLLDLQDPLHGDPAINRIRTALRFGYPDKLRLTFDHGFASAHLELGGLARLVSIGDLHGIPMGPIFDRIVGPIERPDDEQQSDLKEQR